MTQAPALSASLDLSGTFQLLQCLAQRLVLDRQALSQGLARHGRAAGEGFDDGTGQILAVMHACFGGFFGDFQMDGVVVIGDQPQVHGLRRGGGTVLHGQDQKTVAHASQVEVGITEGVQVGRSAQALADLAPWNESMPNSLTFDMDSFQGARSSVAKSVDSCTLEVMYVEV